MQELRKKARKIQRKQDLGEKVSKQRAASTHLKSGMQANYSAQIHPDGFIDVEHDTNQTYKV